jgi:hypothetical protein
MIVWWETLPDAKVSEETLLPQALKSETRARSTSKLSKERRLPLSPNPGIHGV